jgi:general L-amino acid transport system permease protein
MDWRSIMIQVLTLVAVVAVVAFLAGNIATNVSRLGVESGFGFLSRPAGFAISQSLIPYTSSSTYLTAFFVALLNTVVLALLCIVFATALGLTVALARLSSNPLVSGLAAAFVEAMRNVPLLLHLLIWYFVVVRSLPAPRDGFSFFGLAFLSNRGLYLPAPEGDAALGALLIAVLVAAACMALLAGLARARKRNTGAAGIRGWMVPAPLLAIPLLAWITGLSDLHWSVPELRGFNYAGGIKIVPEFVAMTLGLSIYASAFIAEVFRGGINSVPRGQREAGLSLGLAPWLVNVKIVIPLALRAVVPPLGGQYVLLLKNSSLAAAIAYPDLMLIFAGTALNQTGQPLEVMLITLSAYVVLGLAIAAAMSLWNRRLMLVTR